MKKLMFLLLAALALFFVACGSDPEPEAAPEPKVYPPLVIEHKMTAFGGNVPEWVFMSQMELETQEDYEDSYVFVMDNVGQSLDGVKSWASSFDGPKEVARMVSTRVKNKFVGAQVGDKDMVESYMEEVVKLVSEAEFSGARKKADFWTYLQYYNDDGTPDEKRYRYLFLYVVPKAMVDLAIEKAMEDAGLNEKPKTEEEKTARDRVKDLFDSEGL